MKTKKEIAAWVNECLTSGNSIPMCVNGAGFSMITPTDADNWYRMQGMTSEDYMDYANSLAEVSNEDYNSIDEIGQSDIMSDFSDFIDVEDYTIYRINHSNGYNQENFDIQIATYVL